MGEAELQQRIRLHYGTRSELRLFRNNVGQCQATDGRVVRFGLCEGSSDLIGFTSVEITPEMVGQRLAVFTAVEVKTPRGRITDAQQKFIDLVNEAGGRAGVARSVEDVENIIGDDRS